VTWRRTRLLSRVCFGRLFENDLFSSSVSASSGLTWILAALATPGVMFSGSQMFFYAHVRTFAPEKQDRILFISQAFHVDFAMAVAAVITMLVWTSLTPDRRDALVLGPLPVQVWEQALGRLVALAQFTAMFAAAVSVPTAIVFTFLTVGPADVGHVPARIAGHVAATMLGAGFVFFALMAAQLLLAATLGARAVRLATLPLQGMALLAMVAALSFTTRLADVLVAPETAQHGWAQWNPAAWFIGVYRWVAGDPREVFATLAVRAGLACGAVLLVVMVACPLAYRRCLQLAIAGEGRRGGWWSGAGMRLWQASLRMWLRTPLERGLATFITATLTRNHAHRFLIGSYAGIAVLCALPIAARLLGPADTAAARYAWFSVPLGLMCWGAASLRVAMMLPVEPAANWVFKLTEPVDKQRVLSTAVTVIQSASVFPLSALFGTGAAVVGGVELGVMVAGVVLATGLALVQLLTLTLRTVPCTCSYRPGQLRLRVLWPVYLLVWLLVAYRLPYVALWALGDARRSLLLIASLCLVAAGLRLWRGYRARRLAAFVYDEVDTSTATTMGLSFGSS